MVLIFSLFVPSGSSSNLQWSCWLARALGNTIMSKFGIMVRLCLKCIQQEHNARTFEDGYTTVVELKSILLNSLHSWTAGHNGSWFANFQDFMDSCSFSCPIQQVCNFIYFLCTIRLAPLYAINETNLSKQFVVLAPLLLLFC